jgi:hypothetical protein
MATIKIEQFHGIMPRTHPSLLADGMAVTAHNCRLKSGKLVPLRMPAMAKDVPILMENDLDEIGNAKTIHVWEKKNGSFEFLAFPGVTWLAESNLADDEKTRVIISGDTGVSFAEKEWDNTQSPPTSKVKKTWENSPAIYLRDKNYGGKRVVPLCMETLPQPLVKRTMSTELDTANIRYTRFFWTWVDADGRESPVSEASTIESPENNNYDLEYNDGDLVTFTSLVNRGGTWPETAESLRIYKVVTGTETGSIQFIVEVTKAQCTSGGVAGAAEINVKVKDEDAGEVLTEMESAPCDLSCILKVPGNYYCGFSPSSPHTVCFSDVDLLYSWPQAYRYDVDDNIVALAVTSNTVFALTDGWPFVLSGTAPESMTVSKLAGPASCASPRGVVVFKNSVYYVGQQGLMCIYNDADAGTLCTNVTDKVFTKEQWLAKNPSSCVMGQFDGALHLFFEHTDGTHEGLVIDLTEDAATAVTTHDEIAKCLCVDNREDKMYFVREEA